MSASATPRSRSPQSQSARVSSEHPLIAEKHIRCSSCDTKIGDKATRFDVPLIALPRLFNAILGFATVIRLHTAIDAGWWPWEHKVLFILCWIITFWNLTHGVCSVLGYAYWPSPRRTVGLPPIAIAINGKTIVSFGGPEEDESERRRRMKRVQFTIIDLLLAIPTLGFLIYSVHIMYPWWGSRYVGLWPPTVGMIASLVAFEFVVAFFQLFQFFEAKVIGVQLTMKDIYERDQPNGRLLL